MMVTNRYKHILLLASAICFSFLLSYAQPSVKTSVDKNDILIGEQLKVKVEANLAAGINKMNWFSIPDSLEHFEVVDKSKIDSTFINGQVASMTQTITFTSFDSGKWVLPSFKINFTYGNKPYDVLTDSLLINVSFSAADTTNLIRDIKPIMEVEDAFPIWYWVAGGVLLLAVLALLFWLYKRSQKNKTTPIFQTKLSPYEEAMQELEKLKPLDLSNAGEIKIYHTKLAEILKRYLSRKDNVIYLDKTTGEILLLLSEQSVDKITQSKVAASLRCGDAVKFAKFIPDADESKNSAASIKELIDILNQKNTAAAYQPKAAGNQ